ncbi:hypothetical protein VNO77_37629 [Canavalia gladiata]|uniref:Uncharacterized protein n=1 Tax=Canavalia gladiata TaxID=3824 RepID=A0AAN9PW66_CANGL
MELDRGNLVSLGHTEKSWTWDSNCGSLLCEGDYPLTAREFCRKAYDLSWVPNELKLMDMSITCYLWLRMDLQEDYHEPSWVAFFGEPLGFPVEDLMGHILVSRKDSYSLQPLVMGGFCDTHKGDWPLKLIQLRGDVHADPKLSSPQGFVSHDLAGCVQKTLSSLTLGIQRTSEFSDLMRSPDSPLIVISRLSIEADLYGMECNVLPISRTRLLNRGFSRERTEFKNPLRDEAAILLDAPSLARSFPRSLSSSEPFFSRRSYT